jgi:3-phenylpropionate/cinnamic acid dioxygenase small subunit
LETLAMSLGFDYLNSMLEDDREKGVYRCKREMFTDQPLIKAKKVVLKNDYVRQVIDVYHI